MVLKRTVIAVACLAAASAAAEAGAGTLDVWVSIPPQTEIVERVGGRWVSVRTLVQPGHSPTTYEPSPRQLAALWEADLLVRTRVPFEDALLAKVASLLPRLDIVDSTEDIHLEPMADHGDHDHGGLDPHVWLDPSLVAVQASTIRDALCRLAPDRCAEFDANLATYQSELERVDRQIRDILSPVAGRTLRVFHPAYGYFARRYGLEQVAVEVAGKEPTPRQLASFVEVAEREGVRVLFVQPQFLGGGARSVSEAMGARLVELDPLASDLTANLVRMARTIATALER